MRMEEASDKPDSVAKPVSSEPAAQQSQPAILAQETSAERQGEPFEVAILALQNMTLFPETVVPLAVGRTRSVAAVEAALATEEKLLGCITVRPDRNTQDAKAGDLYSVGTLVMIKRMERLEDTMHIIAQGTERIRVLEWKQEDPYLRAVVQILPEVQIVDPEEVEATKRNVQAMIQQALALLPGIPP